MPANPGAGARKPARPHHSPTGVRTRFVASLGPRQGKVPSPGKKARDERHAVWNTAVVPDPMACTDAENWTGGFYELSLEIGDRDDERLQRALTALWRAAAITGCYPSRDREPADQIAVPVTVASLDLGHLRGIARPPLGAPVVCGCFATRVDDAEDWLTLYLPLGALARVDRRVGGFPFGPDGEPRSLTWRTSLDAWLAGVATEVFRHVDFRLGLIGFEVDHTTAAELGGGVPEPRWNGYLLPVGGQLSYTPANR